MDNHGMRSHRNLICYKPEPPEKIHEFVVLGNLAFHASDVHLVQVQTDGCFFLRMRDGVEYIDNTYEGKYEHAIQAFVEAFDRYMGYDLEEIEDWEDDNQDDEEDEEEEE